VPLSALHKFDGCKSRRTVCKIDTKWQKNDAYADNWVIHPIPLIAWPAALSLNPAGRLCPRPPLARAPRSRHVPCIAPVPRKIPVGVHGYRSKPRGFKYSVNPYIYRPMSSAGCQGDREKYKSLNSLLERLTLLLRFSVIRQSGHVSSICYLSCNNFG